MRIFTTKSFRFDHPTGAEEPVFTQARSFSDVPEWVKESTLFKLASKDDSVTITDSKASEVEAEKKSSKKASTKSGE